MPALSFSGTTSQGAFWQQILEGKKTQTCRQPRKRPIKQGDKLKLYWKQRVPKSKKPIHLIGVAVCVKVERLKYLEFFDDDKFARRDGFRDADEMHDWFGDVWLNGDMEYDVIHFRLIEKLDPEELAKFMHQTYEHHAKRLGWSTQAQCQVAFEDLPKANKEVMLSVAQDLLTLFKADKPSDS